MHIAFVPADVVRPWPLEQPIGSKIHALLELPDLDYALASGPTVSTIKELLAKGADPNEYNDKGQTCIMGRDQTEEGESIEVDSTLSDVQACLRYDRSWIWSIPEPPPIL